MAQSLHKTKKINQESDLIEALGITDMTRALSHDEGLEEEYIPDTEYDIIPDPNSEVVDLSGLRGVAQGGDKTANNAFENNSENELENLAELVPDIKNRSRVASDGVRILSHDDDANVTLRAEEATEEEERKQKMVQERQMTMHSLESAEARRLSVRNDTLHRTESIKAQQSKEMDDTPRAPTTGTGTGTGAKARKHDPIAEDYQAEDEASSGGSRPDEDDSLDDYPNSELDFDQFEGKVSKEFINPSSGLSVAPSISTATQTHEVRMPMYLPTFKPATGCTDASDFIVRCFVARLRSGITVVKHGRSRWCKSRLRELHIHPDGRSLSWKPAEGEPSSSKRPPKLDLSTCLEVRHAWSPDPQNTMYTGTPILRQKCEAANAHKSFALIFKQRTVDITAVTADQCKVLMEGFSALCFRLQVASLAGRGAKKGHARPMPEEDGVSTTASATLTNTSTPRGR